MASLSSPLPRLSPRKLLSINPKPTPVLDPPDAPLNSASSSSTTAVPPTEKRTRDQPNLSDCHCCGRRINHTNPKDRLQPLESIWRVVLLCRKCRKKFCSGQTCPYCFKETEHSGNLFICSVCQRKIHKTCARDYMNCAPWCYLGVVDLGYRVCVDCWVPNPLKSSVRICGTSEKNDASKCRDEAKDSMEKNVKDAKGDPVKVKVAVNAKDLAVKKATVAKKTAANANHNLNSVGEKVRNEQKDGNSDCSGKTKVVDDAMFAFRSHQAMNSSPRILRDNCPVTSCSDKLKSGNSNGLSCKRLVSGGDLSEFQSGNSTEIERNDWTDKNGMFSDVKELALGPFVYKREKKRKTWQEIRFGLPEQMNFKLQLKDYETGRPRKWDGDIWEILVCVSSDQSGSCINTNRFRQDPVVYKRARFRRKAYEKSDRVECSSFDDQRAAFEFLNHQSDDIAHELPLIKLGTDRIDICSTETSLPNGNCNPEYDRYFLKYTRMDRVVKCSDEITLPDGSCHAESDRYFVKYHKRIKGTKSGQTLICSDTDLSTKQTCAPFLSNPEAVYSEKCDGEFNLAHGGNDEEGGRFFLKYVKRMKVSHSCSVVEANQRSDTGDL